jgi:hypothetical protein
MDNGNKELSLRFYSVFLALRLCVKQTSRLTRIDPLLGTLAGNL